MARRDGGSAVEPGYNRLKDFQVKKLLGKGAFGDVYKVRHACPHYGGWPCRGYAVRRRHHS